MGLSNAERQRRYVAKLKAQAKAGGDAAQWQIAELKAEIAALTAARRPASRDAPARTTRLERPSELDKLKVENTRLRALLREDPDAAKLRKKVVELQAQAHNMRVAMKQIAKDRDRYLHVAAWLRRVNKRHLDRAAFATIAKCLHPERLATCSKAELDQASRSFLELKPLFEKYSGDD